MFRCSRVCLCVLLVALLSGSCATKTRKHMEQCDPSVKTDLDGEWVSVASRELRYPITGEPFVSSLGKRGGSPFRSEKFWEEVDGGCLLHHYKRGMWEEEITCTSSNLEVFAPGHLIFTKEDGRVWELVKVDDDIAVWRKMGVSARDYNSMAIEGNYYLSVYEQIRIRKGSSATSRAQAITDTGIKSSVVVSRMLPQLPAKARAIQQGVLERKRAEAEPGPSSPDRGIVYGRIKVESPFGLVPYKVDVSTVRHEGNDLAYDPYRSAKVGKNGFFALYQAEVEKSYAVTKVYTKHPSGEDVHIGPFKGVGRRPSENICNLGVVTPKVKQDLKYTVGMRIPGPDDDDPDSVLFFNQVVNWNWKPVYEEYLRKGGGKKN